MLGKVIHACNPRAGEVDLDRYLGLADKPDQPTWQDLDQ